MDESIWDWRNSGKYLPEFLRDFHDQKDFFKAMHEMIDIYEHQYVKDVSWMTGQCYVIDIFLWFLSRFGYKIQKTHSKRNFDDLEWTLKECRRIRDEKYIKLLNEQFDKTTK